MTLDADIIAHPAPAEPAADDPRIARAEMRFFMMHGLVGVGMRLAEALNRHSDPAKSGQAWSGPRIVFPFRFDPFAAFARVFRAVRLAIMLEARIDDEIADLRAGRVAGWSAPAPEAPNQAGAAPAVLGDELREIGLETLAEEIEAPVRSEKPLRDINRPPREDPQFYKLLNGPLEDAVAAICAAFGLKPDWSQWTEDGFPPPPDGDVTRWSVFLAAESDIRPTASRHERPPMTPPPDDEDRDGGVVWRPNWSRARSRKRALARGDTG